MTDEPDNPAPANLHRSGPFGREERNWLQAVADAQFLEQNDEGDVVLPPKQGHYFSDLKRYSTKYLKFQQRKSSQSFANSNGVCLELALMWIKEKLSTTNSKYKKTKSNNKIFSTPSVDNDIHYYNANIMNTAQKYRIPTGDGADLGPINAELNLVQDSHSLGLSWKNEDGIRVVVFPLTRAIAADRLPKGKAVCFEVFVRRPSLENAGHAVSIYRSRGGTLHFFDPNAGAYEVRDIQQFMEAWVTGCGNRGWSVDPYFRGSKDNDDHSWYHVYTRNQ